MLGTVMYPYPPHVPVRGQIHGSGQLGGRIKLVQNQLAGEARGSEVLDSRMTEMCLGTEKVATVVSVKKKINNSLLL